MGYESALNKAWEELKKLNPPPNISVKFLADECEVYMQARKVMSLACNVPAKDFSAILILHYLVKKLEMLPALTGEWQTFKELSGIEGYLEAFRRRAIEPLIRKYG